MEDDNSSCSTSRRSSISSSIHTISDDDMGNSGGEGNRSKRRRPSTSPPIEEVKKRKGGKKLKIAQADPARTDETLENLLMKIEHALRREVGGKPSLTVGGRQDALESIKIIRQGTYKNSYDSPDPTREALLEELREIKLENELLKARERLRGEVEKNSRLSNEIKCLKEALEEMRTMYREVLTAIKNQSSETHKHEKTYADKVKNSGQNKEERPIKESQQTNNTANKVSKRKSKIKWKPWKGNQKFEISVKSKDEKAEDIKQIMTEIKEVINVRETGPVNKVLKIPETKKIVVRTDNRSQHETMKAKLEKSRTLDIKCKDGTNPQVIIYGIDKGYTAAKLMSEIEDCNPELKTFIDDKEIIPVTTKRSKRPGIESWILETSPAAFQTLMKKRKILFEMESLWLSEYISIAICFKCCIYGHVAKYCTYATKCFRCGQEHEGRSCNSQSTKCVNCETANSTELNHWAISVRCPIYTAKLKKNRKYINYSSASENSAETATIDV